jgi:hypothetical protein
MHQVSEKSVAKAMLTSFYIGGGGNQLWTIWVSRMPKLCVPFKPIKAKRKGGGGEIKFKQTQKIRDQ